MKNFEIKIAFSMEAEVVKNYNIELVRGDHFHLETLFEKMYKGEILKKISLLFPLKQISELERNECSEMIAESLLNIAQTAENYCVEEDNDNA